MAEQRYVPDGTFIMCNKCLTPSTLMVNPLAKGTYYGKRMANENDHIPFVNIRPFGICMTTKFLCTPLTFQAWTTVKNTAKFNGGKLLMDNSRLSCSIGGSIKIMFVLPPHTPMFLDDNMSIADRIDEQLKKLGKFGAPLRFALGLSEGVAAGAVSAVEGIWGAVKMVGNGIVALPGALLHPIDSAKAAGQAISNTAHGAWKAAGNAWDWAWKGDNWKALGNDIANASPRDIGKVTGRVGFEVAAVVLTDGAVAAAKAGEYGALGIKAAEALNAYEKATSIGTYVKPLAKGGMRLMGPVVDGAKKLVGKLPERLRNALGKGTSNLEKLCKHDPVDMGSGMMLTELVDLELPGPIPFVWERVWYSASDYDGPLGYGWHHGYDLALGCDEDPDEIVLRMPDGRHMLFEAPLYPGQPVFSRANQLTLHRPTDPAAEWRVWDHRQRVWYVFNAPKPNGPLLPLQRIDNKTGQAIRFRYSTAGHLEQIIDSAGRVLSLTTDSRGRILTIYGPDPANTVQPALLMAYSYDQRGNMASYANAGGHTWQMQYSGHLMTQKTSPLGLSFYWRYDAPDHTARCVHTWGDGGIHEGRFSYPDAETTIMDDLDGQTVFKHERGLVLEEINPLGQTSYWEYNDYDQLEVERNPLGNGTSYGYSGRGQLTSLNHPDGASESWQYDQDDNLLASTDARGGHYTYSYDEQGQLLERTDPLGHATRYAYDGRGQLISLTNALDQTTQLRYDGQGNLTHIVAPDQSIRSRTYDALGRLVLLSDEVGNQQQRNYDQLGQLTAVIEADGSQQTLTYDAVGNVIQATQGAQSVQFTYQGVGRLASRQQAGTRIEFEYDRLERLTGLRNEKGEHYRFVLDGIGQVAQEIGFDGLTRRYVRDAAGQVVQVLRPGPVRRSGGTTGGRSTAYSYDGAGRITGVRYSDEQAGGAVLTQTYAYDGMGALLEARTGHSRVVFERDALGRVVREVQDGHWVGSAYNALGQRTHLTSSLGADLRLTHDSLGQLTQMQARGPQAGQASGADWLAQFSYDRRGLEVQRRLGSHSQVSWEYDPLGRPTEQRISQGRTGAATTRQRRYGWRGADQLGQIDDSLLGTTAYQYNTLGYLTGARYGDGGQDIRQADAVGNLFRSARASDRHYGSGGRLEVGSEGSRYRYDGEGNLIEKVLPNRGGSWHYSWDGAGQLVGVKRPDGYSVQLSYDALGRRTGKHFRGKTTNWLWEGDKPLHEQSHYTVGSDAGSVEALITWLFEEDSFAPIAKLTPTQCYSVITDHLGTPLELHDGAGRTVWGAQLDSYGQARQGVGKASDCPFRYQGQYEDAETGLYYNRFRYYSPQEGIYISQDPIGVMGGFVLYGYVPDLNSWLDPLGLAQRPNNGKYNIFFDHTVDAKHQYSSDGVQFNRANKELLERMKSDPGFRRDMLTRYPKLGPWLKNPNMSSSPPDLTWHHHENTRRLVLVDRADHATNHKLHHPTGSGGRDMWGGGEDGRKGKLNGATGCKL